MEADYGFNSFAINGSDDDEDPDYSNYEQWQREVIAAAEDEEEEEEEEEEDEEEVPAPAVKTKTKTNPQKQHSDWIVQRQTTASKRKSKRKRTSSVVEFYSMLLSWNLQGASSGRTFVGNFPSFFINKTQYFDALKEVVMEETRASVTQSLDGPPEGRMELNLISVDEDGDMMLLELAIVSGGMDMTRPGWVFKLFPATEPAAAGGGGFRGAFGQNNHLSKHSNNHSNNHNNHSKHSNNHTGMETIAVVAQGLLSAPLSYP